MHYNWYGLDADCAGNRVTQESVTGEKPERRSGSEILRRYAKRRSTDAYRVSDREEQRCHD